MAIDLVGLPGARRRLAIVEVLCDGVIASLPRGTADEIGR